MPRKFPVKVVDCFFNSCVMCEDTSKCSTCGWNPKVEAVRKIKLKYPTRKDDSHARTEKRNQNRQGDS